MESKYLAIVSAVRVDSNLYTFEEKTRIAEAFLLENPQPTASNGKVRQCIEAIFDSAVGGSLQLSDLLIIHESIASIVLFESKSEDEIAEVYRRILGSGVSPHLKEALMFNFLRSAEWASFKYFTRYNSKRLRFALWTMTEGFIEGLDESERAVFQFETVQMEIKRGVCDFKRRKMYLVQGMKWLSHADNDGLPEGHSDDEDANRERRWQRAGRSWPEYHLSEISNVFTEFYDDVGLPGRQFFDELEGKVHHYLHSGRHLIPPEAATVLTQHFRHFPKAKRQALCGQFRAVFAPFCFFADFSISLQMKFEEIQSEEEVLSRMAGVELQLRHPAKALVSTEEVLRYLLFFKMVRLDAASLRPLISQCVSAWRGFIAAKVAENHCFALNPSHHYLKKEVLDAFVFFEEAAERISRTDGERLERHSETYRFFEDQIQRMGCSYCGEASAARLKMLGIRLLFLR